MQDLRSSMEMGSSGGIGNNRFFGGGIGGDRRLRPFPNQALKCPRCDSLNTKFCYYNNYNLSQPRHFCKSCRRYWTKGGVLRNVPVGGGIRKTKQQQKSSTSSSSSSNPNNKHGNTKSSSSSSSPEPNHHQYQKEKKKSNNNNSNSSSDSSSLTATTTTATTTHEAASNSSSAVYHQQLLNFNDSAGFASQTTNTTPNSTFDPSMIHQHLNRSLDDQRIPDNQGIFQEPSNFTSLITSTTGSNHGYVGFNLSDISPFREHHQQEQQQQLEQVEKMTSITMVDELKMQFDQKNDQLKLQELTKNFYDQTVPVEMPGLPPNRTIINGELTASDWQKSDAGNYHHHHHHRQGIFDLPSTVDQVFWSQSSQWTEHDHPIYLP
ncbi:hypothetical protein MKX01_040679 [Papaver californicum]|nr:hypothetical protein MKX01_040679 [Papaver californicum]